MKLNLKLNALTALAIVFSVYSGCTPQAKTTSTKLDTTRIDIPTSNIFGGTASTAEFQKQNGIVGLVAIVDTTTIVIIKGKPTPQVTRSYMGCTGTLIDRKLILTAAHCVIPFGENDQVVAIAVNFNTDQNAATQSDFIFADTYAANQDFLSGIVDDTTAQTLSWNDTALVRLSAEAPVDFQVAKRASKALPVAAAIADSLTLTGFGVATAIVNEEKINPITHKPEVTPVEIAPDQESGLLRQASELSVVSVSADSKEFVVDQSHTKGACHGDSGGPAFLTQADGSLLQVGIASRVTNQIGNCGENLIYTSVLAYDEWITVVGDALLKEPVAAPTVNP